MEKLLVPSSLMEALAAHKHEGDKGITFIKGNDASFVSYGLLYTRALSCLGYLQQQGMQRGDEMVLSIADNETFLVLYWAAILGGIIPVPMAVAQHSENSRKLCRIWDILSHPFLVACRQAFSGFQRAEDDPELMVEKITGSDRVIISENIPADHPAGVPYQAALDDIAFIQFSSGSTGTPKGVVLTHRNLLTNVMAIIESASLSARDTTLSWMPLTHDMGLIGFHLTPLIGSMRQCIMPTDLFVRNPARWLQSMSLYKATVSSSPNFGYKHLLRQLNGNRLEATDLSSVRLIMNGAEPISMELCREFLAAMEPYGLKPETMYTVYGLAEATLAVTFPVPEQPMSGVRISRKCLGAGQHVLVDASADHVEFANLGKPVSHCCVRIANEKGAELQEGVIGYVHIKGGGVTSGYYNNEAATKQVLKNGWLNTQDLGFVLNGHLYVTGRAKDVIFSGGLNFYAHDVERIAETLDEIEAGKIVACGIPYAATQTDALVLFVLYRKSPEAFYELSQSLKALIAAHLGIQPHYVVPVKNIPKTTSGKFKRFQLADNFKNGEYNELVATLENIHREKMQMLLPAAAQLPQTYSAAAIEQWLRAYLAAQLQLQPESIDAQSSFAELGLTSMMAVALAEQLEKLLQRKIDATVAWDFANIQALSSYLANDALQIGETVAPVTVQQEPIAVIGMGCRFPGAQGIAAYWDLLQKGQPATTQLPEQRKEWWSAAADKDANTWGGYLDEVTAFDAQFFGISSKEAVYMDPQQRILMEVCWEALEQAGIPDHQLSGTAAGVFIGLSSNDYARMQFRNAGSLGAYTGTGSAFSIAANRLSYFLDLKGPSMAIDTACSSSLVAVYEACNSLRRNDCKLAIAGGVNLILGPELHAVFGAANMLATDGKCKTFDEKADGYVRGEGCGVVILKRLSDAVEAGDNILALIRGAAVNQDGRSNGLTAPNGIAQQAVIRKALQDAAVEPGEISYVEAHGTGTSLGDPIEMNALKAVLMEGRNDMQLWVGAVKTNIGHLEAAAGIAGLIKTVLMLQHAEIPPNLHFQSLNPKILLDGSPVSIPLQRTVWTMREGKKRLAGVSSFGFGGTNSHVVLESAPVTSVLPAAQAGPQLLLLSAKTPEALTELRHRYEQFLQRTSHSLAEVCYTAAVHRSHFAYRLAITADTTANAIRELNAAAATISKQQKTAFLFTGQGSQYVEMGKALYHTYPAFKESIDACDALLRSQLEVPLLEVLFSAETGKALLDQTMYTQPALFAFEYAMARLWQSFGITPQCVVGHSVGEYAAACIAGIFSLEDGLKLLTLRARLMQELPANGQMMTVFAPAATVNTYIAPFSAAAGIAAVNAPALTVVAGSTAVIAQLREQFSEAGIKTQLLNVSHAFHSPLMQPVIDAFTEAAATLTYHRPQLTFISTLTGEVEQDAVAKPDYWVQHILNTVLFEKGIKRLEQEDCSLWLETGPAPQLLAMCKGFANTDALMLSAANPKEKSTLPLLQALGKAYVHGADINWKNVHVAALQRPAHLPTYPFQSKKYWIEKTIAPMEIPATNGTAHPVMQPASNRRQDILDHLCSLVAAALHEQPGSLNIQQPFIEMGADSLLMAEIVHKIEKQYKLRFTINQLFEEINTLERMAAYIDQQLPVELNGHKADVPVANEHTTSRPDVQQVILKQLELMQQQLNTLQAAPAAVSVNNQPVAPVQQIVKPAAKAAVSIFPKRETNKNQVSSLSPRQQAHLDALIGRYNKKTPGSKAIAQRYRPVLADNRASAGFRFSTKEMLYPIIGQSSEGSRLRDVDGNEYVDIAMGFGVNLFGHRPAFVTAAIAAQLQQGMQLGPQTSLAGEAAQLVTELTGAERASFHNSGTEAVMTALRLARTVTGRDKVVIFKGAYHGHFDGTLGATEDPLAVAPAISAAPGVLQHMVDDLVVLEYGNEASLAHIQNMGASLAAVLVEPVQSRNPDLQPGAFLKQLRDITSQHGIALIFDEMITGFRIHPGGAQAWFGVKADLATYGKIAGGGMPIGVVAGKAAFMDSLDGGMWQYGDDSYPPVATTFFAGTFCKHPLTLAAACALLKEIKKTGMALYDMLNRRTTALVQELNSFFTTSEAPIKVGHFGSLFYFSFTGNMDLFFYHLAEKGVYTWEGRTCFLSAAHTEADIDFIIQAVKSSIRDMQEGDFLPRKANPQLLALPLTGTQQQLWALSRMDALGAAAYHISAAIQVRGALQAAALNHAIQQVVNRHEALRTIISPDGSAQQILPSLTLTPQYADFTEIPVAAGQAEAVNAWKEEECLQPFDLHAGPLVRVFVLQLEPALHEIIINLHHIIADGWSLSLLLQEIASLYTASCNNSAATLPQPMQFREHLELFDAFAQRPEMTEQEAYWVKAFENLQPALELPTDRNRPSLKTYHGGTLTRAIPEQNWNALKQIGRGQGCTPFMTMLAACSVLLHRLTMQEDIVIGIPVGGRPFNDYIIGPCLNLLPVRSSIDAATTFTAQLGKIRQTLLAAYKHQDYPFSRLLEHLNATRDLSRSPVIEVLFNFNPKVQEPSMQGLVCGFIPVHKQAAAYDLSFDITEMNGGLSMTCDYNADLFDAATVERYCSFYEEILKSIIQDSNQELSTLNILTAAEKEQVIITFNDTRSDYPADKTIPELFEAQAAAVPDRLAVIAGTQELTYAALNAMANGVASMLRNQYNIAPGDLVGLMMERNVMLPAAMLGILKAGAAYVPLDPAYPESRIQYMLQDSGVKVVLTTTQYRPFLGADITAILLDDASQLARYSTANLPAQNKPEDLMYVIYTSGSTGAPKGVKLRHRNVTAFVSWCSTELAPWDFDLVYAATSYCFDISVFEIFYSLCAGKAIRVMENALEIKQHLPKDKKILLSVVPAVLEVMVREATDFANVKVMNVCGEPFPYYLKALLDYERIMVYNLYGPTEDTVYSTCYRLDATDSCMLIGRPIANSQVYILDPSMNPVPIGVTGEMYLAGAGLAAGYLNKEALTAERFIDNPFTPGERLYRTGDLARWHANGMLEHKGRTDNQVKVRGFRIELGEIETALLQYEGIAEALVIVKEDAAKERFLAAYFTTTHHIDMAALRQYLGTLLPAYMMPACFMLLDKMPMTANGKRDRKALPEPDMNALQQQDQQQAPANDTEAKLLQIWQEVLGKNNAGTGKRFFEAGGHSLKAVRLITRIQEVFNVSMALTDIFKYQTIRDQAAFVQGAGRAGREEIIPVQEQAHYEVSQAQRRLWMMNEFEAGQTAFNITGSAMLEGPLDIAAFRKAFSQLVARHEILRTTFIRDTDGSPRQVVHAADTFDFAVEYLDVRQDASPQQKVNMLADELSAWSFDLEKGPLMRVTLLQLDDLHCKVFFTMHHIISDGWSLDVLIKDLFPLYAANVQGGPDPLMPLDIHYKDYTAWRNKQAAGETFRQHRQYWLQQFEGNIPVLQLPTDRPRPATQTYNGAVRTIHFNAALSSGIQQLAKENDVTVFAVLLTAVNLLLYKRSGDKDIVMGIPLGGRDHTQLENQIGFYTNMIPFRSRLNIHQSFKAVLRTAGNHFIRAYEHGVYPFNQIVEDLRLENNTGRSPLFDIMVQYQHFPLAHAMGENYAGLTLRDIESDDNNSKFDITFLFAAAGEELELSIIYNKDLFSPATIAKMAEELEQLLKIVIGNTAITPMALKKQLMNGDRTQIDHATTVLSEDF